MKTADVRNEKGRTEGNGKGREGRNGMSMSFEIWLMEMRQDMPRQTSLDGDSAETRCRGPGVQCEQR